MFHLLLSHKVLLNSFECRQAYKDLHKNKKIIQKKKKEELYFLAVLFEKILNV